MKTEAVQKILNQFDNIPICLAPMATVNDLAFRMQCRKHGINIAWIGMIFPTEWFDEVYRERVFQTCEEDRPLVCQITLNNDVDSFLKVAHDLEDFCDIIDVDLCCANSLSEKLHFGHHTIQTKEQREQIIELISIASKNLRLPLSIKTRVLIDDDKNPSQELTVEFAQQLESAGVSLISIHARPAQCDKFGNCYHDIIKAVVESVKIPVIANGGITKIKEIDEIIEKTGAAGVMIGQKLLGNPWFLECDDDFIDPFPMAREYIELCKKYSTTTNALKRHIHFFLNNWIGSNNEIKLALKSAKTVEDYEKIIDELESRK